MFFQAKCKSGF